MFARKKNVSDAPFASPPERTRGSVLAQSRSTDRSGGGAPADASHRRPPGRGANPFAEAGGSLESSFEDARAGYAPPEAPGVSRERPSARRAPRSAATRSSYNSQAMGSDGSEPFVIDPERARRPANPTPRARALPAQREKRDAEISKIAARRAQKERERERAAREAEEDAEAERLAFQQKMRAKREQLAAKAAAKGRGGQFASVASAERANEHLHPPREKYKPKGPPPRASPRTSSSSAARGGGRRARRVAARGGGRRAPVAARGGGRRALSPPAAEDSEGLLMAEDSAAGAGADAASPRSPR